MFDMIDYLGIDNYPHYKEKRMNMLEKKADAYKEREEHHKDESGRK